MIAPFSFITLPGERRKKERGEKRKDPTVVPAHDL